MKLETSLCDIFKAHFDILHRLYVTYECDRQTDKQTFWCQCWASLHYAANGVSIQAHYACKTTTRTRKVVDIGRWQFVEVLQNRRTWLPSAYRTTLEKGCNLHTW